MSISPVMSPLIPSYSQSASAKKTQTDSEYEKILILMKSLGIEPTGEKSVDKILLKNAVTQMLAQQASSTSGSDYVPFADIMDALDLDSTGNVDDDYDRTIDELDYRISMASDDEEKQYYTELRDQVETLYSENSYENARTSMFMGSSQISDMNRYMLGI